MAIECFILQLVTMVLIILLCTTYMLFDTYCSELVNFQLNLIVCSAPLGDLNEFFTEKCWAYGQIKP